MNGPQWFFLFQNSYWSGGKYFCSWLKLFFFDTQDLREMHKKNETISKKEEEERQYLQSEYEKVKDENSELQVGCFRVHRTS